MVPMLPPPGEEAFVQLWKRYLAGGLTTHFPIQAARAQGARIETASGASFLDFTTGIGVNNAGHLHPDVVRAVHEQTDRFLHLCFSTALYEPMVELARYLSEIAPGVVDKVAFFNSGAEAVENSVKIARSATGRQNVVVFDNAFHGRTLLAMTMTGRVHPYKDNFGPFAPAVHRTPFADCYRCPLGLAYPECGIACAERLNDVLRQDSAANDTALVIGEPIQGEGGFIVPPPEFFPRIKEICDEHGILLASDEVQAGLGRTGTWLAMAHHGVKPDLVTFAKALGGGLPLSAVAGRADLMDAPGPGAIGGTFGGNPLACAAGLASLKVTASHLEHVTELGNHGMKHLIDMKEENECVGDVRGKGLMLAVELVRDRTTKEPAAKEAKAVQAACYEQGLLILTAGPFDNVIRLLPPLTIKQDEFDAGLDILGNAIHEVGSK